jgi:hypothetical protein
MIIFLIFTSTSPATHHRTHDTSQHHTRSNTHTDNGMCLYVAGDDTGGVSLWRIFPKSAQNVPDKQSVDGRPPLPPGEKKGEKGRNDVHQESRLLCFMNVNYIHRTDDSATATTIDAAGTADTGSNDERIVTLRFLPNTELLLVGTNKRLLLILIGNVEEPGSNSGTGGDKNMWDSTSGAAFSPSTRQRTLSHWLSHSPSPSKRAKTQSLKGEDTTFMSWVELDRVPAHCEGIFSMSVGVGEGEGEGDGQGDGTNKTPLTPTVGSPGVCCEDQSIILWKVVVDCETSRSSRDRVRKHDPEDRTLPPNIPEETGGVPSDPKPLNIAVPKEEKNGSIFSMPSLQTFFNSTTHGTSSPTAPLATPPQTPSKYELNLNLKQEKEQSVRKDRGNKSTGFLKKNFDVDLDDMSDCRVYRFKWTDEMFCTAFQNLKTVPQRALEDHLSKYY